MENDLKQPISQPSEPQQQQPFNPELSSVSSSDSSNSPRTPPNNPLMQSPSGNTPHIQNTFTNEKTLKLQELHVREDIEDFFTEEELEQLNLERKEKQNFLKTEVLLKGYEPKIFGDYISKLKEDGGDIDEWTLEELQDIVKEFKIGQPEPEKIDYFSENVDLFTDLQTETELNLQIFQQKKSQKLSKQDTKVKTSDLLGVFGLPKYLQKLHSEDIKPSPEQPKTEPKAEEIEVPLQQLGNTPPSQPTKPVVKIHKPKTALANSDLTKSKIKITK